jgi:hypothetical protein
MKAGFCRKHLLKATALLIFSTFTVSAVAATSYEFVSRSTDGLQTGSGTRPQVTQDGRYVVFSSGEGTLVTPNARGYQIYLHDRTTHTTELISVNNAGAYGNGTSDHPTVSDDGCRVVFDSYATNLVDGAGSHQDVFVRDRCAIPKQTNLVSADANGIAGWAYSPGSPAQSFEARISGDGRYVAFSTYANNIGGTPTSCGTCNMVVRKNLDSGAIDQVSVKADGSLGSGRNPDISYDGQRIVFWAYHFGSTADGDTYLWDGSFSGQGASLVSTGSNGQKPVDAIGSLSGIHSPGISGNGRYVAFVTGFGAGSSSLTAEGGNGYNQVYVKDTQTGILTMASVSPSGVLGDKDSCGGERPALSYDGRYVAYPSYATNLVTSTAYVKPLIRDLVANQTILVADRSVGNYSQGFSSNGRFTAFSTNQTTLDPNFPNTGGLYLADLMAEGIYDAQIQTMYIGYFGRPADPGGLTYYSDLMNQFGGDNTVMLDDFWNSAESQGLYTQSALSAKIAQVYEYLFGRPADGGGVTYWSDLVATGRITIPSVAYTVAYNAQAADAAVLEKKRSAARAFMNALDTDDKKARYQRNVAPARAWLDGVVDDATLAAALATLGSLVAGL